MRFNQALHVMHHTHNSISLSVSVIDQGHSSYKTDIEHALLHENNNAAVLPGYTLQSETVFSQDNDSFGAMDAGKLPTTARR